MKILSALNNLIEKSMYYVEFNVLLIFSTLFMLFCLYINIIITYYGASILLLWAVYSTLFFKYIVTCIVLLGIFLLNTLTCRKHISYSRKIPRWYKIFFWVLLVSNIVWHTYMSSVWYGVVYNTINNIH